MRKSLIVWAALLVIMLGAAAVCFAKTDQEGTEVEIYETVLYGDKEAVEGLELKIPVSANYRLFWETDYRIGAEPTAETEFQFYPEGKYDSNNRYNRFECWYASGGGGSMSGGSSSAEELAPFGLEEPFVDVASRTPDGEEHSEKVRLKDYFDYFKIAVEISVDGMDGVESYWGHSSREEKELVKKQMEALVGHVKLPVSDDSYLDVTIKKNELGKVYAYDYNVDNRGAYLNSFSVTTDNMLYYVIDAEQTVDGGAWTVPAEGLEEWYGLYRVPYEIVKEDYRQYLNLDYERAECAVKLPAEQRIVTMELCENDESLLLITVEKGIYRLCIIDLAASQIVHELEILRTETPVYNSELLWGEEFLIWATRDYGVVFSRTGKNVYEFEFMTELGKEKFDTLKEHANLEDTMVSGYYNGETLALVYPLSYYTYAFYEEDTGARNCVFWVMAYDKTGLLYCGEYQASQGVNESYNSVNCGLNKLIQVNWEN